MSKPKRTTRVVFIDRKPPASPKVKELIFWGKILGDMDHSYKQDHLEGSLSFRTTAGFVVTTAHAALNNLAPDRFVEVVDCRRDTGATVIYCKGERSPAVDAELHHTIYKERRDIQSIFFGADDLVLSKSAYLRITRAPSERIRESLGRRKYLILQDRGILSFGKSNQEAGARVLRVHERAMKKP